MDTLEQGMGNFGADSGQAACEKTRAYIQGELAEFACPQHGKIPTVEVLETGKNLRVAISACCEEHIANTTEKVGAMKSEPTKS